METEKLVVHIGDRIIATGADLFMNARGGEILIGKNHITLFDGEQVIITRMSGHVLYRARYRKEAGRFVK